MRYDAVTVAREQTRANSAKKHLKQESDRRHWQAGRQAGRQGVMKKLDLSSSVKVWH